MKVTPNLMFRTEAREAFGFYAEVLRADRLDFVAMADVPGAAEHVGAEWLDKVAHAWMQIGDQAIMGSDSPPGVCADGMETGVGPGAGSVALHFDDLEEARRVFDALGAGGAVQMPFGPSPWSPGFGMLRDRFGKDWMINTNAEPAS
ncbi:VOC family protein [Brevundimonas sp. PAMC22021]|uniref:VOC family protein n=1 Tax=Brevundimonas sp. PAMC22021 TaxID=2861285 RepID=UPI001C630E6D|nr:VOC family protein [Brevundimonas sp. PAMC22021]QYF86356.1 VOC family protein [Brevundimonas sp. PAMC22021]